MTPETATDAPDARKKGLTTRGTPRKHKEHRKANANEMQKVMKGMHPAVKAWVDARIARGSTHRAVVFELLVRKGKTQTDVAEILGVSVQAVANHWKAIKDELAAQAPTTEGDFISLREELAARIRHTIDQTHVWMPVPAEGGEEVMMEFPPDARMLAIRLKCLEQLAKLYGVNLERDTAPEGPPPYAAPPEIAEQVRAKVLELHGRAA
jgi:transcriptional regulator with XRE-family HTH domain